MVGITRSKVICFTCFNHIWGWQTPYFRDIFPVVTSSWQAYEETLMQYHGWVRASSAGVLVLKTRRSTVVWKHWYVVWNCMKDNQDVRHWVAEWVEHRSCPLVPKTCLSQRFPSVPMFRRSFCRRVWRLHCVPFHPKITSSSLTVWSWKDGSRCSLQTPGLRWWFRRMLMIRMVWWCRYTIHPEWLL